MLINSLFSKPLYEVAVVIPIYKEHLNDNEIISLDRCLKILGDHPIVVISPEGLSFDDIPLLLSHKVGRKFFPNHYFEGISGYNKLMLNTEFYKSFLDYRYILIYQLDAFVFSDQLLAWCSMSYDHIGAPWIGVDFVEAYNRTPLAKLWQLLGAKKRVVGNGGFSLRKTRTFMFSLMATKHRVGTWNGAEDMFFSFLVPKYLPFIKTPDFESALKFAFELEPSECLKQNNNELPFGCHAWERYDIEFWRPIFKNFGYSI